MRDIPMMFTIASPSASRPNLTHQTTMDRQGRVDCTCEYNQYSGATRVCRHIKLLTSITPIVDGENVTLVFNRPIKK